MNAATKTVCVVGAGNMGHQISTLAALKGFDTWCTDISSVQLEKAQAFVEGYLPGRVAKGKLTQEEVDGARERLHFTPSLEEAAGAADFVIEAAVERLELKRALFAQLDRICPAATLLATNSSFIVSSRIADATRRPEKVCNMHFFNPALVMRVVEVVRGPHTSEETVQSTVDLATALGKTPVLIEKEVYGFVVNRILFALYDEAFHLAAEGVASVQAIDTAVEGALNHPMGPFRLVDLSGVDLICDIKQERFAETKSPADAPPQFIVDMVQAGKLGQKTGSGFYEYGKERGELR